MEEETISEHNLFNVSNSDNLEHVTFFSEVNHETSKPFQWYHSAIFMNKGILSAFKRPYGFKVISRGRTDPYAPSLNKWTG